MPNLTLLEPWQPSLDSGPALSPAQSEVPQVWLSRGMSETSLCRPYHGRVLRCQSWGQPGGAVLSIHNNEES